MWYGEMAGHSFQHNFLSQHTVTEVVSPFCETETSPVAYDKDNYLDQDD